MTIVFTDLGFKGLKLLQQNICILVKRYLSLVSIIRGVGRGFIKKFQDLRDKPKDSHYTWSKGKPLNIKKKLWIYILNSTIVRLSHWTTSNYFKDFYIYDSTVEIIYFKGLGRP